MNHSLRILVTGADGFIGSHLAEHLVEAGHTVRALVQYNSLGTRGWLDDTPKELASHLEVVSGDIRDSQGIRSAVKGCDVVLHLAALIAIPYSYMAPEAYVETNIKGTLNILQACRDLDVTRVVHTSTSEVYGSARYVPMDEEHPLQGQSPYSASKIAADQMALAFFRSFQTPVAIMRPFNTFGPRQSNRAVIPTLVTQFLQRGAHPMKLGSISPTRDFSFVTDTVKGFECAIQAPGLEGEIVNLGTGEEHSIMEVAGLVANILGMDPDIQLDEARVRPPASEVTRLLACNTKARSLLGWSPAYAGVDGFRKGLEKTIEWFSRPENLRRYRSEVYNV